ncbi:M48 family metalloprotease [Thermococcus sp.]
MKLDLLAVLLVMELVIPPLFTLISSKRIFKSTEDRKERTYRLSKVVLIGIGIAAAIQVLLITTTGIMDHLMNRLSGTSMPLLLQALLFALVLISPLLTSIFLVMLSVSSVSEKNGEKKIKFVRLARGILLFIAILLAPILGFGLLWWALMIYLPSSLTSKWWFDFIMYSLLVLLVFALYPEVKVRLGGTRKLPKDLRRELLRFCLENGVKVRDIVVKKSKYPNAMVTGVLPGRRYIILTTALLENFEIEEIRAIIAHEIGHIKGRHLLIRMLLEIGWFLFWVGLTYAVPGLRKMLFQSTFGFLTVFILALLLWDYIIEAKIAIRHEFKADEFAAKTVGVEATIRALEKLSKMSPYPRRTGIWFQAITYHPSIELRVEHLKSIGGTESGN